MYNFRQRLAKHMQGSGENLIGKVFEDVTDKQLRALTLRFGKKSTENAFVIAVTLNCRLF
jgi:hypothetical protein